MQAVKFITGESYATQSIVDSDFTCKMTVVSRTDKTAMVSQYGEKPRRYKIRLSWDGSQESICKGNYSMAGSWGAKDIVKAVASEDAPVTAEELAEAFTGEELSFIMDTFADAVQGPYEIPEDELPANCIPFRRKVA